MNQYSPITLKCGTVIEPVKADNQRTDWLIQGDHDREMTPEQYDEFTNHLSIACLARRKTLAVR